MNNNVETWGYQLTKLEAHRAGGVTEVFFIDSEVRQSPDFFINTVETSDLLTTCDLPQLQQRTLTIQNFWNNKYTATIFVNGGVNLNNLRLSNYILVTLGTGEQFYVKTSDLKITEIGNYNQYRVELTLSQYFTGKTNVENYLSDPELFELNSANPLYSNGYITQNPGTDIFIGDVIRIDEGSGDFSAIGAPNDNAGTIFTADANVLDFQPGAEFSRLTTFYFVHHIEYRQSDSMAYNRIFTIINPIYSTSENEIQENTRNATKYADRIINFSQIELRFYLTESQLNTFMPLIASCYYISDTTTTQDGCNIKIFTGVDGLGDPIFTTYKPLEYLQPEVKRLENAIDLFQVDITAKIINNEWV